jgi:hypothetical protein
MRCNSAVNDGADGVPAAVPLREAGRRSISVWLADTTCKTRELGVRLYRNRPAKYWLQLIPRTQTFGTRSASPVTAHAAHCLTYVSLSRWSRSIKPTEDSSTLCGAVALVSTYRLETV